MMHRLLKFAFSVHHTAMRVAILNALLPKTILETWTPIFKVFALGNDILKDIWTEVSNAFKEE